MHCAAACTGHIADGCGSKLWQWLATEVLTWLLPPNSPISKYGFMGKCSTDYLVSVMGAR